MYNFACSRRIAADVETPPRVGEDGASSAPIQARPSRPDPVSAALAALLLFVHQEIPEQAMRIGVPRETKTLEGRVALVPAACADLVRRGHEVWVEAQAGIKSGFSYQDYTRVGVQIAPDAAALYEKGQLIVKVKEPIAGDLAHLRKDHLLFCYLHLAPEPELTKKLLGIGLTGIAFETVELENGDLPLLAPMSIIAGRIAVQIGTQNFVDPFIWSKVLSGLDDYLARHKVAKLSELIGAFDPTPPKPVHA
jgi:hypothetical protein